MDVKSVSFFNIRYSRSAASRNHLVRVLSFALTGVFPVQLLPVLASLYSWQNKSRLNDAPLPGKSRTPAQLKL